MLCRLTLLIGCLAKSCLAQVTDAVMDLPKIDHTISDSKQFRVYGGDRRSRGTFASFAERQKSAFLSLLSKDDVWHHPIAIRISGQLTDPPVPEPIAWHARKYQFSDTYTIEIGVTLCTDFSREKMTATLIHMLMFEMALRDAEIDVTDQLIPLWLQEGLPGALRLRREGRPSGLFKTMLQLDLIPPATDVLSATEDEIDAVSRSVYTAAASGFVLMLLDQPEGPVKFGKLIHAYGGRHGAKGHNLIARHFSGLIGTAERLEKTWILFCSKLAQPQATEFLSPSETEARLADALKVEFLEFDDTVAETLVPVATKKKRGFLGRLLARAKIGDLEETSEEPEAEENAPLAAPGKRATRKFEGSLEDFERFRLRKDRVEILAPVQRQLLQLGFRSFPLHRPIVEEYMKLVGELYSEKPAQIKERLLTLNSERQHLTELLESIGAIMDDYERTKLNRKSGVFDGYMERAKEIESDTHKARDPISQYMDDVERALE
jgi:hypothetical protein